MYVTLLFAKTLAFVMMDQLEFEKRVIHVKGHRDYSC